MEPPQRRNTRSTRNHPQPPLSSPSLQLQPSASAIAATEVAASAPSPSTESSSTGELSSVATPATPATSIVPSATGVVPAPVSTKAGIHTNPAESAAEAASVTASQSERLTVTTRSRRPKREVTTTAVTVASSSKRGGFRRSSLKGAEASAQTTAVAPLASRSSAKRRAPSPSPPSSFAATAASLNLQQQQQQQQQPPQQQPPSSKRRKRASTSAAAAVSVAESPAAYNLRSRPKAEPSELSQSHTADHTSPAVTGSRPSHRKGKGKGRAPTPPLALAGEASKPQMPRKSRTSRGGGASGSPSSAAANAEAKQRAASAHPPPPVASSSGGGHGGGGSSAGSPPRDEPSKDPDGDVHMASVPPAPMPVPVETGDFSLLGDNEAQPGQVIEEGNEDSNSDSEEDHGDGGSGSGSEGSHSGDEESEEERDREAAAAQRRRYDENEEGDQHHYDDEDYEEEDAMALRAAGAFGGTGSGSDGDGGPSAAALAGMGPALEAMGFGGLRGLSSLLGPSPSKIRAVLSALETKNGPDSATERLCALQELSELLAVGNEDSLGAFFKPSSFCEVLVKILKGESTVEADADGGGSGSGGMDAEMAATLDNGWGSMGMVGAGGHEGSVDQMILASRCLANMMEALPGSALVVVHYGAVPVLCSKLIDIADIELAEQCLSTLEKISEEMPQSIIREGGLKALLHARDFFSTNVQRTAVTAAANCCADIRSDAESFSMVSGVFDDLRDITAYPDQRVSEQAVLAITRVFESYRHHPDKLESLATQDVLARLISLLSPAGGSKLSDGIFLAILKALTQAAKGSPEVAAKLLDAGVADTLYGILFGQMPTAAGGDGEDGEEERVAKEVTEQTLTLTQAVMRRDKTHQLQTLDLIAELLPHLPKDGVFDSKLGKKQRSASPFKVKREESTPAGLADLFDNAAASSSGHSSLQAVQATSEPPEIKAEDEGDRGLPGSSTSSALPATRNERELAKEAALAKRIELSILVPRRKHLRRLGSLILPGLLHVYGASISVSIRQKTLLAMLKLAHYSEIKSLANILRPLPMASFLASILANRDQPALVLSALQMTDLLLSKLPEDYHFFCRREGVMHEVERIADQPLLKKSLAAAFKSEDSVPPSSFSSVPNEDAGSDARGSVPPTRLGGSATNMSSTEAAMRDGLTYRARHLRERHASSESEASRKAQMLLDELKAQVAALALARSENEARRLLVQLAESFTRRETPISTFELTESGLVDALLQFITDKNAAGLDLSTRRRTFSEIFLGSSRGVAAFLPLVERLQESLSRLESIGVVTAVSSSTDDSRRHSASANLLGRQVRLRLQASEPDDIPSCLRLMNVSIHAIATIGALDAHLHSKITLTKDEERLAKHRGVASNQRDTLGGMLAALSGVDSVNPASPEPRASSVPAALVEDPTRAGALPASGSAAQHLGPPGETPAPFAPRRSSRLSGRGITAADIEQSHQANVGPANVTLRPHEGLSGAHLRVVPADLMDLDDPDAPTTAVDQAMTDGSPPSRDEPAVNVQPARDGTSVEMRTPQGTRIVTPQGSRPASAMGNPTAGPSAIPNPSRSAPLARLSYANALKAEPKDWHLEFTMDGRVLDLEMTVYRVLHEQGLTMEPYVRALWSTNHILHYRRIPGPAPSTQRSRLTAEPPSRDQSPALPASIDSASKEGPILRLLRALHNANQDWKELRETSWSGLDCHEALDESLFINNKLTAKLNRQLEEPMIVASSCLPDWATDLPRQFPFLFPFESRYTFLQSTSFGYARFLHKWLATGRMSQRDMDAVSHLSVIKRQKVRVARQYVMDSLARVLATYATSNMALEIEYFDEVGTGLGPTLEFYSLASKGFAEKKYHLWRDHATDSTSPYVFSLAGLFPAPMDEAAASTPSGKERLKFFKLLGQFLARSLMDSRIVDISLSRTFARLILGYDVPLTIASIKTVDRSLAASLEQLQEFVDAKRAVDSDASLSVAERRRRLDAIRVDAASVEDLVLDFTLPGYDIELEPGSQDKAVTIDNIEDYVRLVIEWTLIQGVQAQIHEVKSGISTVMAIGDLRCFTPEELVNIFGNTDREDWSEDTIRTTIKPDHGFNMDSPTVNQLISIVSSYDATDRRVFLQFITGAPKLPVGGFRGLAPPLTVVHKRAEAGRPPDEQLPSVMTCQNYLKMPVYSSKEVAAEKLRVAMYEGAGSFHLS